MMESQCRDFYLSLLGGCTQWFFRKRFCLSVVSDRQTVFSPTQGDAGAHPPRIATFLRPRRLLSITLWKCHPNFIECGL